MIESALFFILGFFCAAFLALMVAPAIWRRAVVLTRRKIEASVPLTLNEIEADKDRMRAEFAMSTRRLEMSVKGLKDKAANHLADIGRFREEIRHLGDELEEKAATVNALEAKGAALRTELAARQQQLEETETALRAVEARLEAKSLEFERMRETAEELSVTASERQVELMARESDVERLSGDIEGLRSQRRDLEAVAREREQEARTARRELAEMANRLELVERKNERLMSSLADLEEKLDRREKDVARLRAEMNDGQRRIDTAMQEAETAQAEQVQMAGDLAGMSLHMSSLLQTATGADIEKSVGLLGQDHDRISRQLAEAAAINEKLDAQIAGFKRARSDDWQEQKRQNAMLREQINDLTAEVVRLTAEMEGPASPIHAALERASTLDAAGVDQAGAGQVVSLADRVRALQKSAAAKAE